MKTLWKILARIHRVNLVPSLELVVNQQIYLNVEKVANKGQL